MSSEWDQGRIKKEYFKEYLDDRLYTREEVHELINGAKDKIIQWSGDRRNASAVFNEDMGRGYPFPIASLEIRKGKVHQANFWLAEDFAVYYHDGLGWRIGTCDEWKEAGYGSKETPGPTATAPA